MECVKLLAYPAVGVKIYLYKGGEIFGAIVDREKGAVKSYAFTANGKYKDILGRVKANGEYVIVSYNLSDRTYTIRNTVSGVIESGTMQNNNTYGIYYYTKNPIGRESTQYIIFEDCPPTEAAVQYTPSAYPPSAYPASAYSPSAYPQSQYPQSQYPQSQYSHLQQYKTPAVPQYTPRGPSVNQRYRGRNNLAPAFVLGAVAAQGIPSGASQVATCVGNGGGCFGGGGGGCDGGGGGGCEGLAFGGKRTRYRKKHNKTKYRKNRKTRRAFRK